jgi:TRAP-type C4-dicarboxylate transport system substrate-binding protein
MLQTDLSAATGLPASHISGIERGTTLPTIPTLRRLAEALHRPIEFFLSEDRGSARSLGMVIQSSSIGGQGAVHFAQLVEQKTGGEFKLRLYQAGGLGTAREQVEALAEGAIDFYIDELLDFEVFAPMCGVVFLPCFFRDREHYHRFLRSDIFREHVHQELLAKGIRLLNPTSNWECGSFELLFSTTPIFGPDDLVRRRFRSYRSDAAVALRYALRTEPVIVEFPEVSEAFKEGRIDAFLVPAFYVLTHQLHRYVHYATYLDYGYTLNLAIAASERDFLKLPPDVQSALTEAAEEAGQFVSQLAAAQTAASLVELTETHEIAIIHPSQTAWQARFRAAIEEICAEGFLAPEMYARLQSL